MQMILRVTFAIFIAVAVAQISTLIISTAATAQPRRANTQINLTEKQVQDFIASLKEMNPIIDRFGADTYKKGRDPTSDQAAKHDAQLELVAKKHGFKDFAEQEDVWDNIERVYSFIDRRTKAFTEPRVVLEKEIADITGDKTMSEQEKKEELEELREKLEATHIQFPSNIELVKKYYDQLADVLRH